MSILNDQHATTFFHQDRQDRHRRQEAAAAEEQRRADGMDVANDAVEDRGDANNPADVVPAPANNADDVPDANAEEIVPEVDIVPDMPVVRNRDPNLGRRRQQPLQHHEMVRRSQTNIRTRFEHL